MSSKNILKATKSLREEIAKSIRSSVGLDLYNLDSIEVKYNQELGNFNVRVRDFLVSGGYWGCFDSLGEFESYLKKIIVEGITIYNKDISKECLFWDLKSTFDVSFVRSSLESADFKNHKGFDYKVFIKEVDFKVIPLFLAHYKFNLGVFAENPEEKFQKVEEASDFLESKYLDVLNGDSFAIAIDSEGSEFSVSFCGDVGNYTTNSGDFIDRVVCGIFRGVDSIRVKADKSLSRDEMEERLSDLFYQEEDDCFLSMQWLDSTPEDLVYSQAESFFSMIVDAFYDDLKRDGEVTIEREWIEELNLPNLFAFVKGVDLEEC